MFLIRHESFEQVIHLLCFVLLQAGAGESAESETVVGPEKVKEYEDTITSLRQKQEATQEECSTLQ